MPPTSQPKRHEGSDSSVPKGDSIKVPLTCPECGEVGLVDWKNLRNGIGCPKCGCQFVISRSGQVLNQADLPHARYSCPRCKKSGAIPLVVANKGARCPGCQLPLVLGPDQRLRSVKESEELRRYITEATASRSNSPGRFTTFLRRNDGSVRASAAALCGAFLTISLLLLGMGIRSWFDRSPEKMAQQFVQACLSGDKDAPFAHVEDEAVQRLSFDRWWSRYFPSIIDAHRPKGDKVAVDIRVVEETADSRLLIVTMKSNFFGSRSLVQQWHLRDGKWLFDARRTLAQGGQPSKGFQREAKGGQVMPQKRGFFQ